jgi:hypothetical protein
MTVIYPEATPAQGNTKVAAVATVAVDTAPDLSGELNAVGTLDLSCFLRDWNPELTTNSGTAPPRLCTTAQMPQEGRTQFNAIEIRYVYDPQGDDTVDENKAKALLEQGFEFKAVVRKGLDARNDAWAVGDRVEVWSMRAGRQNYVRSGDDEFSEYEISQMLYPLAEPVEGVVVA